MVINRPRGTNDFLPADTAKWQAVEELLRSMCQSYGFHEIRYSAAAWAPPRTSLPKRCIRSRITEDALLPCAQKIRHPHAVRIWKTSFMGKCNLPNYTISVLCSGMKNHKLVGSANSISLA